MTMRRQSRRRPPRAQDDAAPAPTAGVITALTPQQQRADGVTDRVADRVNVFIDGTFAFGVPVTVAATLHLGQRLDEAAVVALVAAGAEDLAYARALRYLAARPRSAAEVVADLRARQFEETVVEAVLARLHARGYVDDGAFAEFWVENRNRFRPRGSPMLRQELRQKGIEREEIDAALAEQDEDVAAWAALEGKLARWAGLERQEFMQKALAFLARRGFAYDVCRRAAERGWAVAQGETE